MHFHLVKIYQRESMGTLSPRHSRRRFVSIYNCHVFTQEIGKLRQISDEDCLDPENHRNGIGDVQPLVAAQSWALLC